MSCPLAVWMATSFRPGTLLRVWMESQLFPFVTTPPGSSICLTSPSISTLITLSPAVRT
jgi:hypothetical protein